MSHLLSYSHGTSMTPLLGEPIGAVLDRVAAKFGHREALVDSTSTAARAAGES
jgi:fatty-acyl-CoA synthase